MAGLTRIIKPKHMPKLRTALVGCGKVAHLHAAALQSLPESEFVAACGRSPERANAFAAKYKIAAYTDIHEMLAKSKPQALCICTPHPEHADCLRFAFREQLVDV